MIGRSPYRKFSKDQWDAWLSASAYLTPVDVNGFPMGAKGMQEAKEEIFGRWFNCPVCECFVDDCLACMDEASSSSSAPCVEMPFAERLDNLIEKLYTARVFKREEDRGYTLDYPTAEQLYNMKVADAERGAKFFLAVKDEDGHWLVLEDGGVPSGSLKKGLTQYRENDGARVLAREFNLDKDDVGWHWAFGIGTAKALAEEFFKRAGAE